MTKLTLYINTDLNHDSFTKHLIKQAKKFINKEQPYIKLIKSGDWIDEQYAKELEDKRVA